VDNFDRLMETVLRILRIRVSKYAVMHASCNNECILFGWSLSRTFYLLAGANQNLLPMVSCIKSTSNTKLLPAYKLLQTFESTPQMIADCLLRSKADGASDQPKLSTLLS
jgi:hypothetical protein